MQQIYPIEADPTAIVYADNLNIGAATQLSKVDFHDGSFSIESNYRGLNITDIRVLTLGAMGLTAAQSGEVCYLGTSTVRSQRVALFRRIEAKDIAHATARAFDLGIFKVERVIGLPADLLTRQQDFLLRYLSRGGGKPQAAKNMGISPLTTKVHACRLYEKLDVHNAASAVLVGYLAQIIEIGIGAFNHGQKSEIV